MRGLLKCPFCNLTKPIVVLDSSKEEDVEIVDDVPQYQVCCSWNLGGCGSSAGWKDTKKEAKALWNRRFY